VPADFSFALLGNHYGAIDALANATTFQIPLYEMGVRAVRMLAERLERDAPPQPVTLPCDFVAGHTVGPPPA
jgi:DNA-binding LacI/PurR family transcriptional regulator